ncbi:MAG: hypothetical protein AAGJ35_15350, partial [Myxococcota bacterium]
MTAPMRWANVVVLVFLASVHISIAFTVSGNLFTKLRQERDEFVMQMLAPVGASTSGPTTPDAAGAAMMPATKSRLCPCVPCAVIRFYSYMDSYSVSTKLMASNAAMGE